MKQGDSERRALLEKASIKLFEELEKSVEEFQTFKTPHLKDDFDTIHARMLFVTATERELSVLYRDSLKIKKQVDLTKARARSILEDAKMEAYDRPTFKKAHTFESRPEVELKLRSMTIEEAHALEEWERLSTDVEYLVETIRSYQFDAMKERKDIDTRLKIFSLKY